MKSDSDWQVFDNTKDLLVHIVTAYGLDALFSGKYCSDCTSHLMPQSQKNLIKQAFDCGAVKILQDNLHSDQACKKNAVNQAVKKLIDTYATEKKAAECLIGEFTYAIDLSIPNQHNFKSAQINTNRKIKSDANHGINKVNQKNINAIEDKNEKNRQQATNQELYKIIVDITYPARWRNEAFEKWVQNATNQELFQIIDDITYSSRWRDMAVKIYIEKASTQKELFRVLVDCTYPDRWRNEAFEKWVKNATSQELFEILDDSTYPNRWRTEVKKRLLI